MTDIFTGLSVLSLFILVAQGNKTSIIKKWLLFTLTAFAAATHSAPLGGCLDCAASDGSSAHICADALPPWASRKAASPSSPARSCCYRQIFALSGQFAWTPGGYGVAFVRMLQDGIVAHYLREHCPQQKLKLCPYRDQLPATADHFLWGSSMFNTLGRFKGAKRRDELHRAAFARRIPGKAGFRGGRLMI